MGIHPARRRIDNLLCCNALLALHVLYSQRPRSFLLLLLYCTVLLYLQYYYCGDFFCIRGSTFYGAILFVRSLSLSRTSRAVVRGLFRPSFVAFLQPRTATLSLDGIVPYYSKIDLM